MNPVTQLEQQSNAKLDLASSPLFEPWSDPVSGVTSYILTRRVATHQQSFYYVNPSFTHDARYLWFYCAFPPSGDAYQGRLLGVVDFQKNLVTCFPETQFSDASPMVDEKTGDVFWISGLDIWKRGPHPQAVPVLENSIPAAIAKNRRPLRIATHLTRSADGKRLNIDALIGNECFIGDIGLDADTPFRLWAKADVCYNHAQFSPIDPDLLLIAQDGWHDAATGAKGETVDRIWLLRRGEALKQVFPNDPSAMRGHEWWDDDGQHIWYIHYRTGTHRVNIHTGRDECVWPAGHTHSDSNRTSEYLVGDINPQPPFTWRVAFFNIKTQKEINIVSLFPEWKTRQRYHAHPHPQFCCNDQFICYTTNVLGRADVALVPVSELIAMTS